MQRLSVPHIRIALIGGIFIIGVAAFVAEATGREEGGRQDARPSGAASSLSAPALAWLPALSRSSDRGSRDLPTLNKRRPQSRLGATDCSVLAPTPWFTVVRNLPDYMAYVIGAFQGQYDINGDGERAWLTREYTREAREYSTTLQGLRIRLVDGRELAALMVDCGLGVTEERVYRTYRIDSDFFEEGE